MNYECICLYETDLAQKISHTLGTSLARADLHTFADGECKVTLEDADRFQGKTVLLIQSTAPDVAHSTLALALCAHELKNAGAKQVIAVVPYLGYSRQEASAFPTKPGGMQVIARLFEGAGIDQMVCVELHEPSIIDFFSIPVHNVRVIGCIAESIAQHIQTDKLCVIAPDQGASADAHEIAGRIQAGVLVFNKERFGTDQTRVVGQEGSCSSDVGVMVDDIIATGGTAINVCSMLSAQGLSRMYGYFVHPVLAGNALDRIERSDFTKLFVSNTISLSKRAQQMDSIALFDVSGPLIETIKELLV